MDLKGLRGKRAENYHYMADAMRRLEWDLHHQIEATARIPDEWHEIAAARHAKRKVRVTMGIEEDVLRFFKSMGAGHGPRMNEVLRSYMHARLAGVIKGNDTDIYYRRASDYDNARPQWGDTSRQMGEDRELTAAEKRAERMDFLRAEMRRRQREEG